MQRQILRTVINPASPKYNTKMSWTNTDSWTHQRWDQVPRRSKHPLLTGHTRREPIDQVNGTIRSQINV